VSKYGIIKTVPQAAPGFTQNRFSFRRLASLHSYRKEAIFVEILEQIYFVVMIIAAFFTIFGNSRKK